MKLIKPADKPSCLWCTTEDDMRKCYDCHCDVCKWCGWEGTCPTCKAMNRPSHNMKIHVTIDIGHA